MKQIKIADPYEYWLRFDDAVRGQGIELLKIIDQKYNQDLELIVRWNYPFFTLKDSIADNTDKKTWKHLLYINYMKKEGFRVNFFPPASAAFQMTNRHERFEFGKVVAHFAFDPSDKSDMELVHELITEALEIRKGF